MKWWGWGEEEITFDLSKRPKLWPWLTQVLALDKVKPVPPVQLEAIKLPPSPSDHPFFHSISGVLDPDQICTDNKSRVQHAFGKSYRDLVRVRAGDIPRAPDLVLFPSSHSQVTAIVERALKHDAILIPFGGGTNIVGCVEPNGAPDRIVATVNLKRMSRLLHIDPDSGTATFEAGVLGPQLESSLKEHGLAMRHEPDSFVHSSLGGWIATRSAGMYSNQYGKIEDMVLGLKMVTERGTFETKSSPARAAGPDFNHLILGSEGTLGIITEATMRVHPLPESTSYHAFLFQDYESAYESVHETVRQNCLPTLVRVSDQRETELAFHMKPKSAWWKKALQAPIAHHLKKSGYAHPCIMILGYEGLASDVQLMKKRSFSIFRAAGGKHLGSKPGERWFSTRFDLPYLRDNLLDYSVVVDVAETATVWSNVLPLYHRVRSALTDSMAQIAKKSYVGCHLSHFYESGASLYFTFAVKAKRGREISSYELVKSAATEAIMQGGGTLSHHHAVGYEHSDWYEREVSPPGAASLVALKSTLDSKGVFNPGKILSNSSKKRVANL